MINSGLSKDAICYDVDILESTTGHDPAICHDGLNVFADSINGCDWNKDQLIELFLIHMLFFFKSQFFSLVMFTQNKDYNKQE